MSNIQSPASFLSAPPSLSPNTYPATKISMLSATLWLVVLVLQLNRNLYRGCFLGFDAVINEVLEKLKADRPKLAPLRAWQDYSQLDKVGGKSAHNELSALMALIRRACGIDSTITLYDNAVRRNFQNWILKRHSGNAPKFNDHQMEWLRMIRDHITSSFHLERDDLDLSPFDAKGGLGRMWQLFGKEMDPVIEELNEALAA